MKRIVHLIVVFTLLAALVIPLAAVGAQNSGRTLTVSEEDINSSYRVTNPARRSITDVSVNLQPGQAVIYSTHSFRNRSYDVVSIFVPTIQNGRIVWQLSSATANGAAASQDLVNQVNSSILTSWRNYVRQQHGQGRVQSVEITDTAINVVLGPR